MESLSKNVFELTSENLTNLGGPMGSEYTYDNWRKHFNTIEKAKAYAEKDYGKTLKWIEENGDNICRTEDLNYVMYHIKQLKIN